VKQFQTVTRHSAYALKISSLTCCFFISKDETKLWLSAINTISQANNQAQRQVKMADDNKDGVLSQEEMLRHILLFTTGSQKHKSQGSVKNEL